MTLRQFIGEDFRVETVTAVIVQVMDHERDFQRARQFNLLSNNLPLKSRVT